MLEAYSTNKTISTNDVVPFDSVSIKKGCAEKLNGVATIELNRKGVYEVTLNIAGTPGEAGAVIINTLKDGVIHTPGTISIPLVATTVSVTPTVTFLISVSKDNTNDCCSSPTTLQFVNACVSLTNTNANVVINKIC